MSCCGQTAQQALAAAQHTLDARTAALTHVRLVYTGADKRVQPFVAAGKVYQFGNNERRRTNVVAAAAVPKLMATGLFEVFDPERHNEDGTPKASPQSVVQSPQSTAASSFASSGLESPGSTTDGSPERLDREGLGLLLTQDTGLTPQTGAEAGQGENLPAAPATPASAPPVQPAATVTTSPKARKK